jgi:PDZ domain-containing protein
MGVEIENGATFAYPFGIKLVVGDIDGPSAGLSFTLAVMDWLGGGDLTGGKTVAATGTMSFNGAVGEVGGVAQKAIAVRRAGAAMFIVPRAEYAQARANAGSTMKVVGVDNVSQALSALATIGGRVGKPSGNP